MVAGVCAPFLLMEMGVLKKCFNLIIYLAAPSLSCGMWDLFCCGMNTLSCGMWDPVP